MTNNFDLLISKTKWATLSDTNVKVNSLNGEFTIIHPPKIHRDVRTGLAIGTIGIDSLIQQTRFCDNLIF